MMKGGVADNAEKGEPDDKYLRIKIDLRELDEIILSV
jgi:hypothetical protein